MVHAESGTDMFEMERATEFEGSTAKILGLC